MVVRQFGIDVATPGFDSAVQTLYVAEGMSLKIRGRVHAARSLMIVNHQKIFARPATLDFLHQLLREQMRLVDLDRVVFFARPHIKKVNFLAARDSLCYFSWFDLHRALRFLARDDMLDRFVDIEILIARTNLRERLVRTESATAAPA